VPSVQRLRIRKTPSGVVNPPLADEIVFDMSGGNEIPASQASEGTLIVLGLLCTMYTGSGNLRLLLLDDIEHGLHPRLQRTLIRMIRRLQEQYSDLQIIATTHSPFILDELKPEEAWLTNPNDDGTSSCARLDQHPDFERWKDSFSPGEFWSMVGEDWVSRKEAARP
jgi:predicted ATPase